MSRDPFLEHAIVLSEAERDAVQLWIDERRPELGLSDWRITVTRHAADPDTFATSYILERADESVIALARSTVDADPDELRAVLTHELIHCHIQPVTRLVDKLLEHELGQRTEAIVAAAVRELEERTIDRLARAIARFLPLVELPA